MEISKLIIHFATLLPCLGISRWTKGQTDNEKGQNSDAHLIGSYNVFYGDFTGSASGNTGSKSVFIGFESGYSNAIGHDNVF